MFTTYVVVTVLAAGANLYAATVDFMRAEWVITNMTRVRVPDSWLFALGATKAAGALGLLVGIGLPPIGIAASAGLVLYFIAAVVTVLRAPDYSQIPYPTLFLLLAVGSLALGLATI